MSWAKYGARLFFQKPALDIFRVVHFYEAWLATLAIAVWHFYSTVFKPGVYPGNPAWLTGKMSAEMYAHEHGGDSSNSDEPDVNETTEPKKQYAVKD